MRLENNRLALLPIVAAGCILVLFALSVRPSVGAQELPGQLTPTASATPDFASPTPFTPYIQLFPDCGVPPYVEFTVRGANWNPAEIDLSWDGEFLETASSAFVNSRIRIANLLPGVYTVGADNGIDQFGTEFTVSEDCVVPTATLPPTQTPFATVTPFATPTNEPTDSPTSTPTGPVPTDPVPSMTPPPGTLGPDLVILAVEPLITAPLEEYTPISFRVEIANPSPISVLGQFFFDIFLDPNPLNVTPISIPLSSSSGYMAVSSMAPGSSREIVVVAETGYVSDGTVSGMRRVYGMVDSAATISETLSGEVNNLLGPIYVANITPGPTRTPTATPSLPNGQISGIVRSNLGGWSPQYRAEIVVVAVDQSAIVARTMSAQNGFFTVSNLPTAPGAAYDIYACLQIDSQLTVGGVVQAVVPPNNFADIFMVEQSAGCPQSDLQGIYQQFFPLAGTAP